MKTLLTILTLFVLTFSASAGSATIAFDDENPSGLVAGYGAEIKPDGAPEAEWRWYISFTGQRTVIPGLAPGRYNLRVFAVSREGAVSDPSEAITFTILKAPLNLHIVPPGTVSLQISPDLQHWREVASLEGERWFVRFE